MPLCRHLGHRSYRYDNPQCYYPDSKVHGANMGPTWVLSAPDGPPVGPLSFAIRVVMVGIMMTLSVLQLRYTCQLMQV